jgi:hypothetical protein
LRFTSKYDNRTLTGFDDTRVRDSIGKKYHAVGRAGTEVFLGFGASI